jgi:hypothetical protein
MHTKRQIFSKYLILILLMIILIPDISAQTIVQRIDVSQPNRAIIYCNEMPKKYTTELTADKKKITIHLNNASVDEKARQISGLGIMENVYVQSTNKNLDIYIILKDKRGFTVAPLPYSQALIVEVFEWNKLSSAEDNYRSGLLGMEDGVNKSARRYLESAVRAGDVNAAVFLGMIQLGEGKTNAAVENFHLALKGKTTINDVYAALSQVLYANNNQDKSKYYAEIFQKKTGLKTFPVINIPKNQDEITPSEPVALMELLNDPILNDSSLNLTDTTGKIKSNDSLAKSGQFDNLFKNSKDSASAAKEGYDKTIPSLVPEWFSKILVFIGIFVILMTIIIAYAYMKWRKTQAEKIIQKSTFGNDLRRASDRITPKPVQSEAIKAYKKSGAILDKTIGNETTKEETKPIENLKDKNIKTDDTTQDKLDQDKLFAILSKVSENKVVETDDNRNIIIEEKPKPVSAKLELAMHLREEQRKVKEQSIESLKTTKIPTDIKKLGEVAKSLGIEKGSIETRKALERFESDKNQLSEIEKKFQVKSIPEGKVD